MPQFSVQDVSTRLSATLRGTRVGNYLNGFIKYIAGVCFDMRGSIYRTDGMGFEIPKHLTTRTLRGRFFADTYEQPERTLIARYLPSRATVLELGGCIGVVSCVIDRKLDDPNAHVVIEANPFLIPLLLRNRERNGGHFFIKHCIISDLKEARIAIAPEMDGSSISDNGIAVPTKTVDDIEEETHLRFDSLVIDIEGSEYGFIMGNLRFLSRIESLIVEFHPDRIGEERVGELRRALTKEGLIPMERVLNVECFRRLESALDRSTLSPSLA